ASAAWGAAAPAASASAAWEAASVGALRRPRAPGDEGRHLPPAASHRNPRSTPSLPDYRSRKHCTSFLPILTRMGQHFADHGFGGGKVALSRSCVSLRVP